MALQRPFLLIFAAMAFIFAMFAAAHAQGKPETIDQPHDTRPPFARYGSFADPFTHDNPYCGDGVCNLTSLLDEAEAEHRGYKASNDEEAQGITSLMIYNKAMCANQKLGTARPDLGIKGISCKQPYPVARNMRNVERRLRAYAKAADTRPWWKKAFTVDIADAQYLDYLHAQFPVLAGRPVSNNAPDYQYDQYGHYYGYVSTETFAGTWVDEAGGGIEMEPLGAAAGIKFDPNPDPYHRTMVVPAYVVNNKLCGTTAMPYSNSTCMPIAVIYGYQPIQLTTDLLYGYNVGLTAWGIILQGVNSHCAGAYFRYGFHSAKGCFDTSLTNVAVNLVSANAVRAGEPYGKYTILSTSNGLSTGELIGGTTGSPIWQHWVQFHSGVPYPFGHDETSGYMIMEAPAGQSQPNNYLIYKAGYNPPMPGADGSPAYFQPQCQSGNPCDQPLGYLESNVAFDAFTSGQYVIATWNPNVEHQEHAWSGYFVETTGSDTY